VRIHLHFSRCHQRSGIGFENRWRKKLRAQVADRLVLAGHRLSLPGYWQIAVPIHPAATLMSPVLQTGIRVGSPSKYAGFRLRCHPFWLCNNIVRVRSSAALMCASMSRVDSPQLAAGWPYVMWLLALCRNVACFPPHQRSALCPGRHPHWSVRTRPLAC
jgi:hypothetical protein